MPIWIDYMQQALAEIPENTMARPEGLVDRLVEKTTGQLARPGEPNSMFEYFRIENAPDLPDNQVPGTDPSGEDAEVSIETIF